jgi:hypothetical protein
VFACCSSSPSRPSVLLVTPSPRSDSAARSVIAFIFLFYASYDIAFTPLVYSYTLEILPYTLRAKGFTIFNLVVSLALIFNQYVNPIALRAIGWKYYVSPFLST